MKRDQIVAIAAVALTAAANIPQLAWFKDIGSFFPAAPDANLGTNSIPVSFLWSGPSQASASGSEASLAFLCLAIPIGFLIWMALRPVTRQILNIIWGILGVLIVAALYFQLGRVMTDIGASGSTLSHIGIGAWVFVAGSAIGIVAGVIGAGRKAREPSEAVDLAPVGAQGGAAAPVAAPGPAIAEPAAPAAALGVGAATAVQAEPGPPQDGTGQYGEAVAPAAVPATPPADPLPPAQSRPAPADSQPTTPPEPGAPVADAEPVAPLPGVPAPDPAPVDVAGAPPAPVVPEPPPAEPAEPYAPPPVTPAAPTVQPPDESHTVEAEDAWAELTGMGTEPEPGSDPQT